jgi:hypothetical protein
MKNNKRDSELEMMYRLFMFDDGSELDALGMDQCCEKIER